MMIKHAERGVDQMLWLVTARRWRAEIHVADMSS